MIEQQILEKKIDKQINNKLPCRYTYKQLL